MALRVLILQSDSLSADTLADFFVKRGDQVWKTSDASQAKAILKEENLDLALVDLHLPNSQWLDILAIIQQEFPGTRVIVTNKHPDVRAEMLAKHHGVSVFLREPFAPNWITSALEKLDQHTEAAQDEAARGELPRVRVSMRLKITFPYAVLAIMFAMAAVYLVSRYVAETIQERFTNQLVDAARLSADWMVQEESRLLQTLRHIANTEGVAEACLAQDAEGLREMILPVAVNYQEESIVILDQQGKSILALQISVDGDLFAYDTTQGSKEYSQAPFVQKVLKNQVDDQGDKYSGIIQLAEGDFLFYIAGPVYDENNIQVGTLLVGKSIERLARENRQDTLAHITLYTLQGRPITSTMIVADDVEPLPAEVAREVIGQQDKISGVRDVSDRQQNFESGSLREMQVASSTYSELVSPWEARGGEDLGMVGVALAHNNQLLPSYLTQLQAFLFVALTFLAAILIGLLLAKHVTQPLAKVVEASQQVAQGNLEVKVPSDGNDEVAVLGHAFNYMVAGLQEGFIYRDLLGRSVSPEVREAMRLSFASGDLRLEGQNMIATVLMSDIRGFTSLSEKEEPTTILNWLNEYFGELVPVVTRFGGVVDKFEGDAMLAFFGILPTMLPPEESANNACQAAMEMLEVLYRINQRRQERGEPPLLTGIGVNTGILTAGGLGTSDRLNYTIIGDTVNTTQRMQGITRKFGESAVVVSESTLSALRGKRTGFRFEPLGEHAFAGKAELLWLYRLLRNGGHEQSKG